MIHTIAKQPDPVPQVRKCTKSRKTTVSVRNLLLARNGVKPPHKIEHTETNTDLAVLEMQLRDMQLGEGSVDQVYQDELQDARAEAANYRTQLIEAFNRLSERDKCIKDLEAFKSEWSPFLSNPTQIMLIMSSPTDRIQAHNLNQVCCQCGGPSSFNFGGKVTAISSAGRRARAAARKSGPK